jgi:hypothetical protein
MSSKKNNNLLSLIIQGPVKSNGINFISNSQNKFHSFERIVSNILAFKKFSDNVILSTYVNELTTEETALLDKIGVKVVINEHIKPLDLSLNNSGRPNNTIAQFTTLLRGLEELQKVNFNGFVIKVRTDIALDIKSIVDDLLLILNQSPGVKFMIPYLINRRMKGMRGKYSHMLKFISKYELYMLDFYFCADINFLEKTIDVAMNKLITTSAHRYLLTSILSFYYPVVSTYKIELLRYKFTKLTNSFIYRIIESILTLPNEWHYSRLLYRKIWPLSLRTMQSLEWRDSNFDDWKDINKNFFEYYDKYCKLTTEYYEVS